MWYYQYAVEWFSDIDNLIYRDNGIIAAEDNKRVIVALEEMYGDNAIEQIWFQPLTEGALVLKTEEASRDESFREYLVGVEDIDYQSY